MSALSVLPVDRRAVIAALVDALSDLPGIVAIALGGSWARGTAHTASDVDLALYYRDAVPPDLESLRAVCARFDSAAAPTAPYAWGPWVNGGAWLRTTVGRVDLIYRSLDQVRRVLDEAAAGQVAWDFHQQPPFGFHNVIYFAETTDCVPLRDAEDALAPLKASVRVYPEALRDAIVTTHGWGAEFSLHHAEVSAERSEVYAAAGGIVRVAAHLTQVLFALNRVYFATDKGALEAIDAMAIRPASYAASIQSLLAAPGAGRDALCASTASLAALVTAVVALAGRAYRPPFRLR
jgi:Nucleotidyltransferase domain